MTKSDSGSPTSVESLPPSIHDYLASTYLMLSLQHGLERLISYKDLQQEEAEDEPPPPPLSEVRGGSGPEQGVIREQQVGAMEELIDECGGFGYYQALILFGICVQKLSVAWSMMQMSYSGYVPNWQCEIGGSYGAGTSSFIGNASTYTTINNNSSISIMSGTAITSASAKNLLLLNQCSVNNSDTRNLETDCTAHRFDGSARTVITEWDLVCDRKWIKATITSIQMAGVLIGSMFAGQLADLIGRKKSLFGFVLMHSLLNFGAAFAMSWKMYAGFTFALGIGAGAVLVIITPYPMEFLPTRWRPIIVVIPVMATGVSVMAMVAFFCQDWSYLHIACGLFGLPFLLCYFFVPESVRWLTLQGRNKEAEEVIAKMASVNGCLKPLKTEAVLKAIHEAEEMSASSKEKKYTYGDLFKTRDLAKLTVAACFLWFTNAMAIYGISFGATHLAGNLELNILLVNIVDQPFVFSTFYFINRFGRKKTCLGLYSIALLGACGCFGVQFINSNRAAWVTGFSLFSKMGIGAAWGVVGVWSTESYPTVVRSVGSGIVNSAAKVGGIAAPFVVDLDNRPEIAYAVLTVLFLVAMLVCLVIPESKGCNLSDSINTIASHDKKNKKEKDNMGDNNLEIVVVVTGDSKNINADKEDGENRREKESMTSHDSSDVISNIIISKPDKTILCNNVQGDITKNDNTQECLDSKGSNRDKGGETSGDNDDGNDPISHNTDNGETSSVVCVDQDGADDKDSCNCHKL